MAIINAAANGLWSSSATWPGSVFPTSADDVFANNRTIYIDQNITVNSLNTTAGAGGVAGGRFYANQGNLTINSSSINAGTTYCVTVTGTGTRTLSTQFIRASDTTNTTAAVLIQGTAAALSNVITYGNAVGGSAAGSSAANQPAAITIEGGSLTHYGFISGGNVRGSGLKIYQSATSTIPVTAIVYGNVKGGTQSSCPSIVCEYTPATNILSSCLISIYGDLSGGDALLNGTQINSGLYTATSIYIFISGNIFGGSAYGAQCPGVYVDTTVTPGHNLNIVGNIYNHPNFGFSPGLFLNSNNGNVNLSGNIIALDANIPTIASNATVGTPAVQLNSGNTSFNVLGNVFACTGTKNIGGIGIYGNAYTGTISVTGDVYGGTTGQAYGIFVSTQSPTINIYGNVYGSSADGAANGAGIFNNTVGRVNVFGDAVAGEGFGNFGIVTGQANTTYVRRAVANSFGHGSAEEAYNIGYGVVSTSIGGVILVEEMVFGKRGQIPVFGPTYIVNTTTNSVTGRKLGLSDSITSLSPTVLVDTSLTGTFLPAVSNVTNTTVFNNNTLTGTMIVPLPSAVSYGVPVDNTLGTAFITPSGFWNTETTQLTSLTTTIGFRLNNTATTEYIGNTLAAYNI